MVSAIVHVALVGLLLSGAFFGHQIVQRLKHADCNADRTFARDSYALPTSKKVISGGGGGGDHDPLPAPKGRLPKAALQQITPPAIVMRNERPKLAVEPTVVVPPQVHLADNHMPNLGHFDSNGHDACGTPIERHWFWRRYWIRFWRRSRCGPWPWRRCRKWRRHWRRSLQSRRWNFGAASDFLARSGLYRRGTEAKKQGTCVLWLIVDSAGHPRDIRVVRGLGLGLDAKALEAVRQWRFQPALKDGKPVDVQISVEVEFHLY